MNKNQLSKLIRFLFVEKKYGIKEITNNEVWLLKIDSEFPIICVVLNERKDQSHYDKKYKEYALLLQSNQPLLLINKKNIEKNDYTYQQGLETTFIQELLIRESYKSSMPDFMLGILQNRFKNRFGFIRWTTLLIGFISLVMLYLSFYNIGDQSQYLFGGYFRYGILKWNEYYRMITMLFSSNNLFLLIVCLMLLYHYEQIFSIEHGRKLFIIFIILNTLLTSILLILLKVEVIESGLSSLVMSLSMVTIIKFYYLWFKYPKIRRSYVYPFVVFQFILILFLLINDTMSAIVGGMIGLLFGLYFIVKEDSTLLKNYIISFLILVISLGYVFVNGHQFVKIESKILNQLKNSNIENQYYKIKIEMLERKYEK